MVAVRKVEVGLLGLAWACIGIAYAGVANTPRIYCNELPTPSGQAATVVGLAVAAVAVLAGMTIESWRESSARSFVVALAIATITIAAGIAVAVLAAQQTGTWGCG
jgi:hypothetical protein